MGIPRPLLLLLLGMMLLSVTFVASRNARQSADDPGAPSAPPPQQAQSLQPTPQKPAGEPAPAKPSSARASKPKGSASESAKAAAAARKAAAAATPSPPKAMVRALEQRRVVVLFLAQPRQSGDDAATAQAVAALRGRRGVAVFRDTVDRLERYGSLVGDLGVSQAPAIVIVDRSRQARVIEGFVDQDSLAQAVADLR